MSVLFYILSGVAFGFAFEWHLSDGWKGVSVDYQYLTISALFAIAGGVA